MNKQQEIQRLLSEGVSQRTIASTLSVSRKTIRKIIGAAPLKHVKPTTEAATVQTVGKSLADFRNQYDKATIIPAKIKAALKQLGGGWEYEVDFGKIAGVTAQDLGRFRDQFSDHFVQIGRDGRRAWAGTTTTAKAMREML